MNSHDLLLLKKRAAKISLDNGSISRSEYEMIMKKIEQVEQDKEYQNKLREYMLNEAKQKLIREKVQST